MRYDSSTPKVVKKYLNNYAEPESALLTTFPTEQYQHCTIIPCYDENIDFIDRIENTRFETHSSKLFIIVINQPDNIEHSPNNIALHKYFISNKALKWQNTNLALYGDNNNDWLIVDRYSAKNKIPSKQGVGLARKIGGDIASALATKKILMPQWAHSTDADTHLPPNYFAIDYAKKISAMVYKFDHINDNSPTSEATQLYQKSLNFYVAGLEWAGSNYAFHTIGSCIAFNIESYCAVRGFPKRSGGEDFYLLNKLAKVHPVHNETHITLTIEPRESHRVPFGTGPATSEILSLTEQGKDYCYYDPEIFKHLKAWLSTLNTAWPKHGDAINKLDIKIQEIIKGLGVDEFFKHAQTQSKDIAGFQRAAHHWFDAFKTLKFIHAFQNKYYNEIPFTKALEAAPWEQA